jgi:hypothetical protein
MSKAGVLIAAQTLRLATYVPVTSLVRSPVSLLKLGEGCEEHTLCSSTIQGPSIMAHTILNWCW